MNNERIKFCFTVRNLISQCYKQIKVAFDDSVACRTHVFKWFRKSQDGKQSIESITRNCRNVTSKSDEI